MSRIRESLHTLNQPLPSLGAQVKSLAKSKHFSSMVLAFWLLMLLNVIGMVGYKMVGGEKTSWLDSLYMAFITIATIGYSEIIDMTHSPVGRVFTMIIAFVGIALTTYMFSTMTATILESDLNSTQQRKRMERSIKALNEHYIICGIGRVGANVADELLRTGHPFVIIESDPLRLQTYAESTGSKYHFVGDATADDILLKAGVATARGVFAVAGEDATNLVISMSARQLNPKTRIIARIHDPRNAEKTKRAGADDTVSPDFTGGMRLASAMLRPSVVSFLDRMLKAQDNVRVEEIDLPTDFAPRPLSSLKPALRECVLVAAHHGEEWSFHPPDDYIVNGGTVLITIATPEGRRAVEAALEGTIRWSSKKS